MCVFLSWLHYEGEDLFLTDDIFDTDKGKELIEYYDSYYWDDITGHGALMHLHKLGGYSGDHIEKAFFDEPLSFPIAIREAIHKCKFRRIGMPHSIFHMLRKDIAEKLEKVERARHEVYKAKRSKISNINNEAIEKLRGAARIKSGKYGRDCEEIIQKAYKKKNSKLTELEINYKGPMNICPERKALLRKKQEVKDEYYRIEDAAVDDRGRLRKECDPGLEVDKLFKKSNRELNDVHYEYMDEKVNRFWDLFENINKRKKIWREI